MIGWWRCSRVDGKDAGVGIKERVMHILKKHMIFGGEAAVMKKKASKHDESL